MIGEEGEERREGEMIREMKKRGREEEEIDRE